MFRKAHLMKIGAGPTYASTGRQGSLIVYDTRPISLTLLSLDWKLIIAPPQYCGQGVSCLEQDRVAYGSSRPSIQGIRRSETTASTVYSVRRRRGRHEDAHKDKHYTGREKRSTPRSHW